MLLDEIDCLSSYDAIANVLDNVTLADFQSVDLLRMLAVKKAILRYDTGMGKTLMASAFMRCLKRENKFRRFIFFIKNSQLIQTPKKVIESCGLKVLTVTGERSQIESKLFERDFSSYDVLMLTHECLNNLNVMNILHSRRAMYHGVIIDEAHELCNYMESSSAFMLRGLCSNYEYVIALTATPVTTSLDQMSQLFCIVDRNRVPDAISFKRDILDYQTIPSYARDMYISRVRQESTYIPIVEYVKPMPHQIDCSGHDLFPICKGRGAYSQVEKLKELINARKDKRGLIYINRHEITNFITEELSKTDIRFAVINGKTKQEDRKRIMDMFNDYNELDVVITNVTTSVDLDCDYVIFYEFTTDVKQMLGRAERGLNPKTLEIIFIFTLRTQEIDYFIDYIYRRSVLIQSILGMNYNEIINIGRQLGVGLE